MKYFIDTEFLEGPQDRTFLGIKIGKTKPTIDLISIGIVAEDGREYYAVSKDFNLEQAWKNDWIKENVLRSIFYELHDKFVSSEDYKGCVDMMFTAPNFKYLLNKYGKTQIQLVDDILKFTHKDKEPSFYAYYADYDWVVFCWIFGRMMDLPKGFPMYCNDLKQMLDNKIQYLKNAEQKRNLPTPSTDTYITFYKNHEDYPKQENEHNALADARWNKTLYNFIEANICINYIS